MRRACWKLNFIPGVIAPSTSECKGLLYIKTWLNAPLKSKDFSSHFLTASSTQRQNVVALQRVLSNRRGARQRHWYNSIENRNWSVDIPADAVLLVVYLCLGIFHAVCFFRLSKKTFVPQAMVMGFCFSRVVTMALRMAWANNVTNKNLAIASNVFINAGVLLIVAPSFWKFLMNTVRRELDLPPPIYSSTLPFHSSQKRKTSFQLDCSSLYVECRPTINPRRCSRSSKSPYVKSEHHPNRSQNPSIRTMLPYRLRRNPSYHRRRCLVILLLKIEKPLWY